MRSGFDFMADGGYATPSLWLSDGWANTRGRGFGSTGYWRKFDGAWFSLTLAGRRPVAFDCACPHM